MKYTKFQRYLSFITLFFFLFSTTIHLPLPNVNVFADEGGNNNIVSIIVEEETYKEISGGISKYAENISKALGNTQVVIFPTPFETSAYQIAALNESLYNQGLEKFGKSEKSKLIGTILVGKLDIPIVHDGDKSQKSIVPYIDFEDKFFTYDHQTQRFQKNQDNINGLSAEIWHGVINPNVGTSPLDDVELLNQYFEKNNDFYTGEGIFSNEKIILNGNQNDYLHGEYEPYVFYFDQFREFQSVSLENYNAYNTFLNHKEDIIYQRYTKKLAETIKKEVLGSHEDSVEDLANIFGDDFSGDKLLESGDLDSAVPDIQTRHIINKTTKKFVEIFSKGSIGELRKNVYNAGRYNYDGNDVNVDFIPYLVTLLDSVNDEIVKEAIEELESHIDQKVETQLQQDIYVPYKIEEDKRRHSRNFTDVYVNLLYGKSPQNISSVGECSPYFGESGSGQLVFANRGLNTQNIDIDTQFLTKLDESLDSTRCMANIQNGLTVSSIFGGNTPINIDAQGTSDNGLTLDSHNKKNSLFPISDIKGSTLTTASFSAPSYTQCLESNYYAYTLHKVDDRFSSPDVYYQLPALGKLPGKGQYDCRELPKKVYDSETYESLNQRGLCSGTTCRDGSKKYYFKKISSVYKHKQPTLDTIKQQIAYGLTPHLPVDKIRYVDFKNKQGDYQKIAYPALFNFPFTSNQQDNKNYTIDQVDELLKQHFEENVDKYAGENLYNFLQSKPTKTLVVGEDTKELKYYDSLVFALYWSNLNSASAKYQFILQNYLGDQFQTTDTNYHLPKSKKQYEIAYLGAPGNADSMHIQLNPEAKGENPYADIIQENAQLQAQLLGENISQGENNQYESDFKCAPPEGVPIFEWIPAIVCWIDDMLPPTISISESTCGTTIPLLSQQQQDFLAECNGDEDKNGVNDCLEKSINSGTVKLSSQANTHYLNQAGSIFVELLDENENTIVYNNTSDIKFKLVKVEGLKDENKEFIPGNIQTIYDGGEITSQVKKYIHFTPTIQRVSRGKAQTNFSTTSKQANYYFQAEVVVKNNFNDTVVTKNSEIIKVEVRADKLYSQITSLSLDENKNVIVSGLSGDQIVSDEPQIFIIDEQRGNLEELKNIIYSENNNATKTLLTLNQKNRNGEASDIQYPLTINVYDQSDENLYSEIIEYENFSRFYKLPAIKKSGDIRFDIIDNNGQVIQTQLYLSPEKAADIVTNIGSNILESNGAITTNVITVVDKFGNPLSGERLTIEGKISGSSLVFSGNKKKEVTAQVLEGYQILRLESLNNTGVSNISVVVRDENNTKLLETTKQIRVVENIDITIDNTQLKVGGNQYTLELTVGDSQVFDDFESRVYFNISDVYAQTQKPYFDIKNGKAEITLITNNIASESVPVEIQIEGLKTLYNKEIEILHDEPAYIQLGSVDTGVEANGQKTDIVVFVKDKYGNIAYSLNGGNITMEVAKDFQKFLSGAQASISKGIATLQPETSTVPGVVYYKVDYAGLQTAGMLQTYFHLDADSLSNSNYNALYTTLLGAAYGDITQSNYLAKSFLFAKDNKSLAVTSLLNSPYEHNDVVFIEHQGAIRNISNGNNLSTDIVFSPILEGGKLSINVRNIAMGDFIAKISPQFGENAELVVCNASNGDFVDCLDEENNIISLQSQNNDYKLLQDGNTLFLQNRYGEKIFEVDDQGNIQKAAGINLELVDKQQKYLQINISNHLGVIGSFVYSFSSADVLSHRLYDNNTQVETTAIVVSLADELYVARNEYGDRKYNKVIYYNDPFETKKLGDGMGDNSIAGYEQFQEKKSIGWGESNKTLLSFAAGETVGDSVKNYQSLGVINLGDPVLKLKKIQRELPNAEGELRNYDSTIGTLLSNESDIQKYQIFDYNSDNRDDILLITGDKNFKILENIGNSHKINFSRGNIGNIFDLGNTDFVVTGDFAGDGYDDIFFVNNQGTPYLLSNDLGDFVRGSLEIQMGNLSGVQDIQSRDMDNDGIGDIVILDKTGSIHIYYGGSTDDKPLFRFSKNSQLRIYDDNIDFKVSVVDNKLVFIPRFKTAEYNIGNIYPISSGNIDISVCNNLITCDFNSQQNLAFKNVSGDFSIQNNSDSLQILYKGEEILSVDENGFFTDALNLTLQGVKNNNTQGFEFEIYFKDIYVTNVLLHFENVEIIHENIYEFAQSNFDGNYLIVDGGENFIIQQVGSDLWNIAYNDKLPKFDKKFIGNVELPDITNPQRSDSAAFYFDSMPAPQTGGDMSNFIAESQEFNDAIQQNVAALSQTQGANINTQAIQNLVYVPVSYSSQESDPGKQGLIDSLGNNPEAQSSIQQLIGERDVYLSYSQDSNNASDSTFFMRSEYGESVGIEVLKNYNGSIYQDYIEFDLTVRNNSGRDIQNFVYVEEIIEPFSLDYSTIENDNNQVDVSTDISGYDFTLKMDNFARGDTIKLRAKLKVPEINLGTLELGYFEADEQGVTDDEFVDIIYKPTNQSCSQAVKVFYSCESSTQGSPSMSDCREFGNNRFYSTVQDKMPSCDAEKSQLPQEVSELGDSDGNGVPDYLDKFSGGDADVTKDYAQQALDNIQKDSDNDGVPDYEDDTNSDKSLLSNLEDINENIDHVITGVDNIIQGLSCGFGGGGCIATPLNWAPLAPGGDPTLFGTPIGDGLKVDEGLPVFSALTWMTYGPICGPAVWPISPMKEGCSGTGAGGSLGVDSPSNFFRLFVTPTLTGGMGVAACFGGPARIAGYANMPGLHPLMPGGNCIVTAMPLASCSSDGSNGDPSSVGFSQGNTDGTSVFNANCGGNQNPSTQLDIQLVKEYINYQNTGEKSERFEELFKDSFSKLQNPSTRNTVNNSNQPLISFGGQSLDAQLAMNVDFSAIKSGNFEDIIQVKNQRVSAFPDFLMGWVTRQIEEIVTKLTDLPTILIIFPDFSGVLDFGDVDESDFEDLVQADSNIGGFIGNENLKAANSGIKEAYTMLANLPLIKLKQETISIDVPWISQTELTAAGEKWSATRDQWKEELDRAKKAWSFGKLCGAGDTICEKENEIANNYVVNVESLIGSLEQNLEVIESYKQLPKDLGKLVKKKEDYLEQILCNVEAISEILGGWIGKNGERFKAWVELYILIKAILKSWQMLIDVFVDYNAQCHECKNERGDLMTFIWKLISAVIPDIPVIQFPKLPDIIIDLHNVRAGLTITLPEFNFGTRPMVLPSLPNLYLPDTPNVSINLPTLPVLPTITIPELPDLPGLPTVELPNLPPPPTLPKMFAQLEGILDILKAITKAMCILKTSPFVPEWRAGDQIAFLTERQGYLPSDFIDISLPQFSFPFIDAIEITSYVNLEFETDFITELVRQVTMPLTTFSNDFTQILNLGMNDLDFRGAIPPQIDINIGTDGVDGQVGLDTNKIFALVGYAAGGITQGVQYLDTNKDIVVSNGEFKQLVAESLSSEIFTSHPNYGEFKNLWDEVFEYGFESEDKFIAELQKNNTDKFETLENILHTEILKNKQLLENLDDYLQPSFMKKVDRNISTNIDEYNKEFESFNKKLYESVVDVMDNKPDQAVVELQQQGNNIVERIETPLQAYSSSITNKPLFANQSQGRDTQNFTNQCYQQTQSEYRYEYKGLYAVEEVNNKSYSYNLFDYKDELDGQELLSTSDLDNDGDHDYIVMYNGQIYMKENLKVQQKTRNDFGVLTIKSKDNDFYNSDIFYPAVDNFREGSIDSNQINARFSASTQQEIYNYRMTFNTKIDRSEPTNSIVDSFSSIDDQTKVAENDLFISYNNLAILKNLGHLKYIELTTKELKNIRDDIQNDSIVSLSRGTKIYAGENTTRLGYVTQENNEIQYLFIGKYSHIELLEPIKVVEITQNAYVQSRYNITLRGEEIRAYKGLPIFDGAHMKYVGSHITPPRGNTYVDIQYFDGTQALVNFNFIDQYWLYDLGVTSNDFAITLDTPNDFKYAYIQSFHQNVFGVKSNQIALSPQIQADSYAPVFYLGELKIPVYQSRIIDLTDLVYEDSGLEGIRKIQVNMNLEDPQNPEYIPDYKIIHTKESLKIIFGPYDELFSREISFEFTDGNGNTSKYLIPFEVYAPNPEIVNIQDNNIYGNIDEELSQQPVSFYRYRAGEVTKLESQTGQDFTWTDVGEYNMELSDNQSGLEILYGNTLIAFINEITGHIDLKDFASSIEVFASNNEKNDNYYPKIEIIKNNQTLYYQYLKMKNSQIDIVDNFENIENGNISIKMLQTSQYGYYQIPNTLDFNPGSLVIYDINDADKQPLFVLFPDGRIQTGNNNYILKYDNYQDFIKLQLIHKNTSGVIAEVVYALNGGYIIE